MTFAQFPEVVHYQEKTMSESETKGMIVRISAEHRQQIDELSVLCGTSEQHIAAMLMRLALTHAPIVDAVKRHFAGPVQVEP
ncbi:MAG: hypothetical protein LC136_09160 [Burkholderiales bacterium]|nr:hypothetical protein [Burkholderiales bacterium]